MKKIKEFYKNNRIYCILMGIGIFCVALIAIAFVSYFVNQTKGDTYGNRLVGIENVKITDTHKTELINQIKQDKKVDKVSVNIKGKIIYINIYLNEGKYEDAQNIAIKSLEALTTDEKDFYDINFTFAKTKKEENSVFPVMGYKKSDATIISWTKANGES